MSDLWKGQREPIHTCGRGASGWCSNSESKLSLTHSNKEKVIGVPNRSGICRKKQKQLILWGTLQWKSCKKSWVPPLKLLWDGGGGGGGLKTNTSYQHQLMEWGRGVHWKQTLHTNTSSRESSKSSAGIKSRVTVPSGHCITAFHWIQDRKKLCPPPTPFTADFFHSLSFGTGANMCITECCNT